MVGLVRCFQLKHPHIHLIKLLQQISLEIIRLPKHPIHRIHHHRKRNEPTELQPQYKHYLLSRPRHIITIAHGSDCGQDVVKTEDVELVASVALEVRIIGDPEDVFDSFVIMKSFVGCVVFSQTQLQPQTRHNMSREYTRHQIPQ